MKNAKPSNEIARLIAAFGHAIAGLKAACRQPAFRIELLAAAVMIPLALLLPKTPAEHALLVMSVFLVLIVELLNTAVETVVDRISTEWHELSKIAKDTGSAAVLLSLLAAGLVWLIIVFF